MGDKIQKALAREAWQGFEQLGRVCVEYINVRAKPSADSPSVGVLKYDDVVVWLREVVGEIPTYRISSRWVETPDGFIYAPNLQPVKNIPNTPIRELPRHGDVAGMWAEVTVPYVDITTEKPPIGFWLQGNLEPRLYFSQILWIDSIKEDADGKTKYRVNEKYSRGDLLWADAAAFRPLTKEDISPIHPDAENKRILVNLRRGDLSCFEGKHEAYYCKVSAGLPYDEKGKEIPISATPRGKHPTWRKMISTHMEGGTAGGGYDLPGVAWTTLFIGTGEAIHSTFWHNDFGAKRSHGCVNCSPEDAKWIFRWSLPEVEYYPGEKTISMPGGTVIEVIEG